MEAMKPRRLGASIMSINETWERNLLVYLLMEELPFKEIGTSFLP